MIDRGIRCCGGGILWECIEMSESNHWGNVGAQNAGQGTDWFKRQGASDSQAAEAAAASQRAKQAQSGGKS